MSHLLVLVCQVIGIYELVIIIAVVISWVWPRSAHPAVAFVRSLTEPVFGAIRRAVRPVVGGVDLSPLLAMLLCELTRRVLIHAAGAAG